MYGVTTLDISLAINPKTLTEVKINSKL